MRVIAFDQSSTITGFAVFEDGKYERSGVLAILRGYSSGSRLKQMMELICHTINSANANKVIIEDIYASKSAGTAKMLAQLQGAIIYHCYINELELEIIAPTAWRKRLGFKQSRQVKRWALKKQAVDFIEEYCGKKVSDDEADAVCIGLSEFIKIEECEGE